MYDLVILGGRVIDPGQGLDGPYDVAFRDGKVAEIAPSIEPARAAATITADGALVVPGLIDLHTHVYWGATSLSVRPEPVARRSGATTLVDAGSAGAGNFLGFREFVIERSPIRILPYLNISFAGIFAFSKSVMMGETSDVRLLDARECLEVARQHRDLIVGIKVRVGRNTSEAYGVFPLELAVEVAEELALPVMAHIDFPPPRRRDMLDRLRPGDVLTHCFRPFPNAPVVCGEVRKEMLEALAELQRAAPDLGRAAWVASCLDTRLDVPHDDYVSRNAFGELYPHRLCPAHPAVRDYVVNLCSDLAHGYDLAAVVLEVPGWLPCDRGYHPEFAAAPLDRWARTLLSLCFAATTRHAAKAAGIDADRLQAQARQLLESYRDAPIAPADMTAAWWFGDVVSDPEWAAFLDWRCRQVADLVTRGQSGAACGHRPRRDPAGALRRLPPDSRASTSACSRPLPMRSRFPCTRRAPRRPTRTPGRYAGAPAMMRRSVSS